MMLRCIVDSLLLNLTISTSYHDNIVIEPKISAQHLFARYFVTPTANFDFLVQFNPVCFQLKFTQSRICDTESALQRFTTLFCHIFTNINYIYFKPLEH